MPRISSLIAWTFAFALTSAVILAAWNQPSVENGMAFYMLYHQNRWNQLIHFFGVPAILFSSFVYGCHLRTSMELPAVLFFPQHQFSVGTFWTLFYLVYYLSIDSIGGTLFAPVLLWMYWMGVQWVIEDQKLARKTLSDVTWTGTGAVLKWALWVQLISWYCQIHPGHGILEGTKPALLDSLGGSFSSAPLFAFYEGIWLLGFRTALRDQVQELARERTLELCQGVGAALKVCATL
jgi:2-hydroxy fatty acid dioxygenase